MNNTGFVYKLVSKDIDVKECYVGSTVNTRIRKAHHKSDCNNVNGKLYNYRVYQYIRDNSGFTNWDLIVLETVQYNQKYELKSRERHHMELLGATLNTNVPNRNKAEYNKQYQQDNAEHLAQKNKQYHQDNVEHVKQRHKQYREANPEYDNTVKITKNTSTRNTIVNMVVNIPIGTKQPIRNQSDTKSTLIRIRIIHTHTTKKLKASGFSFLYILFLVVSFCFILNKCYTIIILNNISKTKFTLL